MRFLSSPASGERPDDSGHQVENHDDQIADGTIVTSERNPRNAKGLGIRHAQVVE
jgi:hypothetical protein